MKISNYECSIFLKELNNMLEAGMSNSEALDIILEGVEDKKLKDKLIIAKKAVDEAYTLSDALNETEIFDTYFIQMIKIGENTGYLDKVTNELAKYYERLDNSYKRIKEAILYPSIILMMMLVVMGVITIKVLPVFETVLANMGTGLNNSALAMMSFGKFLANDGFYIIMFMVLLVVVYILIMYFKYKQDFIKEIFMHNFITSHLANNLEIASFSFALSLLINAGIDEKTSVEMLKELISSKKLVLKIDELDNKLNEGSTLCDAICDVHIFKSAYERMLKVAYKSGRFESALNDVAIKYEGELDFSINKFLNKIEPSIIILCSVIVGIILLSVMLPLLSVMSSI